VIVGTNGEITSRKAIKKLALRCQCLRLGIFILFGSNTQNLADGEFVLHPQLDASNKHSVNFKLGISTAIAMPRRARI
jgi:hypothetical protein